MSLIVCAVVLPAAEAGHPLSAPPDEQLLGQQLQPHGYTLEVRAYSDSTADWPSYALISFKGMWGYNLAPHWPAVQAWLRARQQDGSRVVNSPEVILWNARKDVYLTELQRAGFNTTPSVFITAVAPQLMDDVQRGLQLSSDDAAIVIKPIVSASALDTLKLSLTPEQYSANQQALTELLARHSNGIIAQRFIKEIANGEYSLVFVDAQFVHCFVKMPAPGGFLSNQSQGGSHHMVEPPPQALQFGEQMVQWLSRKFGPSAILYCRIDGCMVGTEYMLMELELIEPGSGFTQTPQQPQKQAYVNAVLKRIQSSEK